MADNTQVPIPATAGDIIASDDVGGVKFQRVKLTVGADGVNDGDVSSGNPLPITGALTDTQLRAAAVPVQDVGEAALLLVRILGVLMSPMGFDRSLSRQRGTNIIESGTVTTVTTVTNLSTIDTLQGRLLPLNQNAAAWAATVRSCIS